MSGTRLEQKTTPLVHRFPKWSPTNYYDQGHVVCRPNDDSENINIYVCIVSHISNDSENRLYPFDSELNKFVVNDTLWAHYISTTPVDSDERSPAAITQKTRNFQFALDSDQKSVASRMSFINTSLPQLPDSEELDSDTRIANQKIAAINSINIISTFVDSAAKHNEIIVWDSDAKIYKTRPVMLTLNTFGPEADGNIPLTITKVIRGTKDDIPSTEDEGTVFIIVGDSDSESNGNSIIYSSSVWKSLIGPDRILRDAKYLRVGGQNTMTGPLLVGVPTAANQIVSKQYVDDSVKDTKQTAFGFVDSDFLISVATYDSENLIISREAPSLWFYDKINITVGLREPYLTSFVNVVVVNSTTLIVKTRYFSRQTEGKLELLKNNVLEPFTTDSDNNVSADSISGGVANKMKLINPGDQEFTIYLTNPFSSANKYVVRFTTHNGDVVTLTKDANSLVWYPNKENFDFGTY
jgi:hypothetical protein